MTITAIVLQQMVNRLPNLTPWTNIRGEPVWRLDHYSMIFFTMMPKTKLQIGRPSFCAAVHFEESSFNWFPANLFRLVTLIEFNPNWVGLVFYQHWFPLVKKNNFNASSFYSLFEITIHWKFIIILFFISVGHQSHQLLCVNFLSVLSTRKSAKSEISLINTIGQQEGFGPP